MFILFRSVVHLHLFRLKKKEFSNFLYISVCANTDILLARGGVESARVLDYHNHLRLKKGNAIEPPYHYIHDDNDDFIFILFFSFNHHRATFYSTTLAPV